jgi:hypothetical protein
LSKLQETEMESLMEKIIEQKVNKLRFEFSPTIREGGVRRGDTRPW